MNGTSIRNIRRNMAEAGGYPRSSLFAGRQEAVRDENEYCKHAAVRRWIARGMPDEPFTRPMNDKQRREATRTERAQAHLRRLKIAERYTTGKTAFRKANRRAQ